MVCKTKSKHGGLHTKRSIVEHPTILPHDAPQSHTQPAHILCLPKQNPTFSRAIYAPILQSMYAEDTTNTHLCAPIAHDET